MTLCSKEAGNLETMTVELCVYPDWPVLKRGGHISSTLFNQQKAQPGEGTYADLGDFHQKAPAPAIQEPLKMPPTYEKTEYAEISQFLRAPVTTDEEAKDESSQDDRSNLNQEESSPQEYNVDNSDVRSQEILLEI